MDVIKTYIPKRFRNKKLVNTGSGSGSTTIINSGNDISPSSYVDSDTFYSMFELVDLSGTPAIKAKHEFFSVAGVTAYGTGTVATGGSGSSVSVLDVLNSTDTGSALSANMGRVLNEGKLNRSEISSWALGANKPAYGISEITGLSASLSGKSAVGHSHTISEISDFAHVHQWSEIENKPTKLSGYGITDATPISTFYSHNNDNIRHITSAERTKWDTAYGWGDFREFGLGTKTNNVTDYKTKTLSGFYGGYQSTEAGLNGIHSMITMAYSDDWIGQLFIQPLAVPQLKLRARYSGTTWSDVFNIYHSGNFTPGDYTPLSTFNTHNNDNVRHITSQERTNWNGKVDKTVLDDMFVKVNIGTAELPVWAIKTTYDFFSEKEIAAFGAGATTPPVTGMYGLSDVLFGTLTNGDVLIYNYSNSKWENKPQSTIIPDLTAYAKTADVNTLMTAHTNAYAHGNIANGQTAFGWGNHASAGYALNSALSAHIGSNGNAHGLANATTAGFMGSSHFNKLAGIESGANNYTHPATHAPSIIAQDADNRFFTDTERTKLSGIATGAEVNVQSDWNAASGDAYILNKPTSLPASDVYSWAKASVKPTYVWSEIGSTPTTLNGYGITDAVTLNTEQYIAANKTFAGGINGFVKQASKTNPVEQPVFINGTGGATLGESAAIGFHNPGRNYSNIVYHDGLFKFMNSAMSGYNGIIASTGNFTNLTANYIPKQTASGLANSIIYDNGTNVGIGTASPAALLDVNGIGKFKDDILMTFKTWTKDSSKSLKSFLDKFDIDTAGNLVVKTNLYSTGEVTAYSSGTGVSGLKLMGNLNANGNNIEGINVFMAASSEIGNVFIGTNLSYALSQYAHGIYSQDGEYIISAYEPNDGTFRYADNKMIVNNGQVSADEFKFGNYSFKQSANGLSICFNGVEQAYITNTGQYVNS